MSSITLFEYPIIKRCCPKAIQNGKLSKRSRNALSKYITIVIQSEDNLIRLLYTENSHGDSNHVGCYKEIKNELEQVPGIVIMDDLCESLIEKLEDILKSSNETNTHVTELIEYAKKGIEYPDPLTVDEHKYLAENGLMNTFRSEMINPQRLIFLGLSLSGIRMFNRELFLCDEKKRNPVWKDAFDVSDLDIPPVDLQQIIEEIFKDEIEEEMKDRKN